MPIAEREGQGQVLRGVCPKCGTVTKGKEPNGQWISKCPHPGARYEGRMMPGGKKTVPEIPDSVDRGSLVQCWRCEGERQVDNPDLDSDGKKIPCPKCGGAGELPGTPAATVQAAVGSDIDPRHGELEPVDEARVPIRGMIDPKEKRDPGMTGAKPVGWQGGLDKASPTQTVDPIGFDVKGALAGVAAGARGMASAVVAAQQRIRELERAVVEASIESAKLREALEDAGNEVARLEGDVKALEGERDMPSPEEVDAADVEGVEDDAEPSDDAFDPEDFPF